MKLKKSAEKDKQKGQAANRKISTEGPLTEKKVNNQEATPPVYSETRSIELDLEKLAKNRCVCVFPDSPETEYYRVLWANIKQHSRENNWNTIMITSAYTREGKTLTAINLAITVAKEFNQAVLLVDCDLKRQSIHRYLDFPSEKGIVNHLVDDFPLKDLIVWPGIEKLTLISGGKPVANSAKLLGSPKMKALVYEIKNLHDDQYVILDAPPILGWADIIAFAPLADCILMVVEEGRTSIQDVKNALEMIPTEKFLGFILNRRNLPITGYYY
ncbi:MAG: AAA family ATPase [Thermodesulfobacteriota bacterium]|nr:AAA family ATPase [Thermodesulfobacteriota bacterium]